MVEIVDKIELANYIEWTQTPASGAINVFIGTVRNNTQDREVEYLDFESYDSMAIKEMEKICSEVRKKWPVHKIAMIHAKGRLAIGDVPVLISVSSAHRDVAFEACKYAIDELKVRVPIWKKEVFVDGEVWVSAHP